MANVKSLQDLHGSGSDSDDDQHNEYYAGGEKSGQVIRGAPDEKDKKDKVGSIFDSARQAGAEAGTSDDLAKHKSGAFSGTARTLDGGARQDPDAPLTHVITFWRNGVFTVDDGPPRSVEDPANMPFLESISAGECPRELDPGTSATPITVNLVRKEEDYQEPEKPKYVAFQGSGRTLAGAGASSSGAGGASSSGAGAGAAAAAAAEPPLGEWEGVDESQPTTSLQLRLSDGSRMVARFNTHHTVTDIRRFIRASRPDMTYPYQLVTGFPAAPLADEAATLEAAGLLNAVVTQRK